jgi:hypothetical protein
MADGLTDLINEEQEYQEVPCEETLREVFKAYPEIDKKDISVRIEAKENPEIIGAYTLKGIGFSSAGYSINGIIPQKLIDDGYSQKLIKAVLAHEFGHIVNGDLDLKGSIFNALVPITGNIILKWREHKADKEAIRRGFGKEMYEVSSYMNSLGRKQPSYYYSASQIAELMKKYTA